MLKCFNKFKLTLKSAFIQFANQIARQIKALFTYCSQKAKQLWLEQIQNPHSQFTNFKNEINQSIEIVIQNDESPLIEWFSTINK